jgi:hypothetical protein
MPNGGDNFLLLDTDSNDPLVFAEKHDFVNEYIEVKRSNGHIKTIWAVPEFEIVFLTNDKFMRKLMHKELDGVILDIGKNAPKRALKCISIISPKDSLGFPENKDIADGFFQTGIIKEISDFIAA